MSTNNPLVSIGIPTYNRPEELRLMLEVLLAQTYEPLDIIIVDNASTDTAVETVGQEYAARYRQIRYVRNHENVGVLRNAAEVLGYASGKYFCWVSDDDWRAPEFIQMLVDRLEHNPDVEFAFCDFREVTSDGQQSGGHANSHRKLLASFENKSRLARLLAYYFSDGGKCNLFYSLFRTDTIRGLDLFRLSGGYRELNMDCMIAYRMLQVGRVLIVPELLCVLTCGNVKHYGAQTLLPGWWPLIRKLFGFVGMQFKGLGQYVRHTDRWYEKAAIIGLYVPKLLLDTADRSRANLKSILQGTFTQVTAKYLVKTEKGKKIELANVTLIALATKDVEETVQAIIYSRLGVDFGQTKLIAHYRPFGLPADVLFHRIEKIGSIDEWSYRIVYDLGQYVETEYALLVHADGFVVNPSSWRDDFLNYDYIGAPWPLPKDDFSYRDINGNVVRVGNSVSLRSKRLLDLPRKIKIPWESDHGYFNEDGFIAVKNKHIFEANGMRFAPLDAAKYFSHEAMIPEVRNIRPFAFHKWAGSNRWYPKLVKK